MHGLLKISSTLLCMSVVLLPIPFVLETCQYTSDMSPKYVVKVPYGRRSQVADGHLGWAQVADARCVSHIGIGSNFQPSLIWLTHILNYLYLKVQV